MKNLVVGLAVTALLVGGCGKANSNSGEVELLRQQVTELQQQVNRLQKQQRDDQADQAKRHGEWLICRASSHTRADLAACGPEP